jgi:mono/diheme cytochrome c family protein
LNAVVGIKGTVDSAGQLTRVGITCALCHSTVDDSFAPGIGKRLDGWANTDLDVGAIVALSPALDDATKAILNGWGRGNVRPAPPRVRWDAAPDPARHLGPDRDPVDLRLEERRLRNLFRRRPDLVLERVRRHRADGRQGQLPRRSHRLAIAQSPDLVTPKLPALLAYQLSLETPNAPAPGDVAAARRGKRLFNGIAGCASCHQGRRSPT